MCARCGFDCCGRCSETRESREDKEECGNAILTGAAAGAIIGGLLAGPGGAIVGGLLGSAAGADSDTCRKSRS